MKKIVTYAALALAAALPCAQLMAQGAAKPAQAPRVSAEITTMYNELSKSTTPRETIAALAAKASNPSTLASVATVVGVPADVIKAGMPNLTSEQLTAAIDAALADPGAFTPATAAGISGPERLGAGSAGFANAGGSSSFAGGAAAAASPN
jgi:hypothetical protein